MNHPLGSQFDFNAEGVPVFSKGRTEHATVDNWVCMFNNDGNLYVRFKPPTDADYLDRMAGMWVLKRVYDHPNKNISASYDAQYVLDYFAEHEKNHEATLSDRKRQLELVGDAPVEWYWGADRQDVETLTNVVRRYAGNYGDGQPPTGADAPPPAVDTPTGKQSPDENKPDDKPDDKPDEKSSD